MAMTMHVDIVSAEEAIFSGPAEMVFAPAEMGEIGVLPKHTPFLSALKPGEVRVRPGDGEEQQFYISGGIVEVQPNIVTILADTALRAKDLDEAEAIEAKQRAEEAMSDKQSEMDYAKAQTELAEAAARLHMIQRLKGTNR